VLADNMDKVLVIVVTYNGMKWLDHCVKSIVQSDMPLDIFVVDNGSTDGTIDFLQDLADNGIVCEFMKNSANLGFGAANNLGLNYAVNKGYDYVYLLNQDAWVFENTVSALMDLHRKNPEYGILSPFQLEGNESHIDANFRRIVCDYHSNAHILDDVYFGRKQEIYAVPWVMAAHWLIPIDCIKKVGGFSPTFYHYGEDDNYTNRVTYHGLKIGICPKVTAVHDRENREYTKANHLYYDYVMSLRKLSDINGYPAHGRLHTFLYLLSRCYTQKSFVPLRYFLKLMREYPSIVSNRNKSLSFGAFLNTGQVK
jgi:GT2 family glycosyltransferase